MKKNITIALLCIIVFTSCNNEKKGDAANIAERTAEDATSNSKVTCMINGKLWTAKSFLCGISKKIGIVGLTFSCPDGKNTQQLLLATLDYKKDYKEGGGVIYKKAELGGFNMNLAGFSVRDEKFNDLKNYNITEGAVKLTTAKDDRAIGTFSFTAMDKEHGGETITVTDGKFDVEMYVEN
jgi:hypothetical protein